MSKSMSRVYNDLVNCFAQEREKSLSTVNRILAEYGYKLVEKSRLYCPVEDMPEITQDDIVLELWTTRSFRHPRPRLVAVFVAGEDFPRVKDGSLPDGFMLKRTIADEDEAAPWYKGYKASFLIVDDEPILAISGKRIHMTDLGRMVQYEYFKFAYTTVD